MSLRIALAVVFLWTNAGIANAADAHQCALADASEKRISAALQIPPPCVRDDQCYVVNFGCPFPCATALGSSQRGMVEAAVKDYRTTHAAGACTPCTTKCDESVKQTAKCVANRCVLNK